MCVYAESLIPCYDDNSDIQQFIITGNELFFQRRYNESAEHFKKATGGIYEESLYINIYKAWMNAKKHKKAIWAIKQMVKNGCFRFWLLKMEDTRGNSGECTKAVYWEKVVEKRYLRILQKNNVRYPVIATELLKMAHEDQMCLNARIFKNKSARAYHDYSHENLMELTEHVFKTNYAYAKKVMNDIGFPGYNEVGKEAAKGFWLIVQHSDFDRAFQKAYLEQMRIAVGQKNIDPAGMAYLTDRIRKGEGLKQVYGTQLIFPEKTSNDVHEIPRQPALWPVEDEKGLNKLRMQMGLTPIEEYVQLVTKTQKE